jgi:hypothetical protein
MWRWLERIFSVLCLLLVIATAILWVRSYWTCDSLSYAFASQDPLVQVSLSTGPGMFHAELEICSTLLPVDRGVHFHTKPLAGLLPGRRTLFPVSFYCMHAPTDAFVLWMVGFPMWASAAFFLLILTFCLPPHYRRWHRARRRRRGLCETCGYDLRASPERCPECGTPVMPLPTSTAGETPAATPEADTQRGTHAPPAL